MQPVSPPGVSIRALSWHEQDMLAAHLLRLNASLRYCRFTFPASDETVLRHVQRLTPERTYILGAFIDGELRGVGERHASPAPEAQREAELAFSVEEAYQRRGIGTALFRLTALAAAEAGFTQATMTALPDNRTMRRLAARHGVKFRAGSRTAYASLPLAFP